MQTVLSQWMSQSVGSSEFRKCCGRWIHFFLSFFLSLFNFVYVQAISHRVCVRLIHFSLQNHSTTNTHKWTQTQTHTFHDQATNGVRWSLSVSLIPCHLTEIVMRTKNVVETIWCIASRCTWHSSDRAAITDRKHNELIMTSACLWQNHLAMNLVVTPYNEEKNWQSNWYHKKERVRASARDETGQICNSNFAGN